MVAVILFAGLLVVGLLVFLAVFARNPSVLEAQRAERRLPRGARQLQRIPPRRLRALAQELLESMGLEVLPDAGDRDAPAQRFTAVQRGPIRDVRHIVFVEAAPPGDLVEGTTALALAEQLKAEPGGVGLMITPYAIDRTGIAGLDASVELVDGARLRELFARHLPHRVAELEGYRFGRLADEGRAVRGVPDPDHHAHMRA